MSNPYEDDNYLEGFNPFAVNNQPAATTSVKTTTVVAPNVIVTTTTPSTSKEIVSNTEDKLYREKVLKEIEQREKELKDLEKKLEKQESDLRTKQEQMADVIINNFPPFPKCCPLRPCWYQDIDVEIAVENRPIIRFAFYLWIAYYLLVFLNMLGMLAYMIVNNSNPQVGATFGVSIAVFLLSPPLCYVLWFRPIYNAFRKNSSLSFFMFFITFAAFIITLIIQCLGISVLGSCGWIISFSTLSMNTGAGVLMTIIAAVFTILLALCLFLFFKVHRIYRSGGGSFSKAQSEFRQTSVTTVLAP